MWPEPEAQGHIDRSEGLERGGDFPLFLFSMKRFVFWHGSCFIAMQMVFAGGLLCEKKW
jgi:hypothetical protein